MENQVIRRRMNRIASHLAVNEEVTVNHVFPMNCSSSLNPVIRRCDNRVLFARQGSISQACFMRQVSIEQDLTLNCPVRESDDSSFAISGEPMFARPAQTPPELLNVRDWQTEMQGCKLSSTEPPKFARPNSKLTGEKQIFSKQAGRTFDFNGIEWSPQMDVAESGCNYVLMVELPGVSIKSIRVEMDDQNLIVTGQRSTQWWRDANGINDSAPTYHRREILRGPYQVIWLLPNNVNKDCVSAKFVDGFLQIVLPKL